ncbi:acylglycerol kinase family protein [Sphingomonas sp. A2-49]|uniref:diacylglycerol/lipid kinase family protein n=1 Tax=Sphingomonas sp. A2-49 TaxID=1391375 RepID=UPI0021CEC375|nr:acylglycerol kinase family protein [Sphingomonas sp. A2-49]MCU6455180.1 acylglycerol kinase family protein [Sphingomonas sp. A2-49]
MDSRLLAGPARDGTALLRRAEAVPVMDRLPGREPAARLPAPLPAALLVGVIANGRSHRNLRTGMRLDHWPDVLYAAPDTFEALEATLRDYAARRIGLLVVNGGDGTLRDVMTAAARVFDRLPPMAIIPSGKTNALAIDLGIPDDWTVRDAIAAARAGRFVRRAPVEILRGDAARPDARGFLFGMGGFVRATELAQSTHRVGAFNGIAVALSLGWSIAQTAFGGAGNAWRRGMTIDMAVDDAAPAPRQLYLLLASTLERMPVGLKPFGRERPGLKLLTVDAPPRNLFRMVRAILAGTDASPAVAAGFARSDPRSVRIHAGDGFILDGEHYAGGDLTIRAGEPIRFAAP